MDRFVAGFEGEDDGDLVLCRAHGVAYQRDMTPTVAYDAEYHDKCASYEGQEIANRINDGRMALVDRHFGIGRVVDIGIGSGEFIKRRPWTFGHDVNPVAVEWLKKHGLWAGAADLENFGAHTFWDVLEHVPDPGDYLRRVRLHAFVFVSVPIFEDMGEIRKSRHYRPGEHLYYWTEAGFVQWMDSHGFLLLEHSTFETDAGRDSIHSFAFKRNRCPQ
jgi:hypothetical protein